MSWKPTDYFLGALEFFGVVVPGAVAVWAIRQIFSAATVSLPFATPSGVAGWAALGVLSLIVGYLAHPPAHILNKLYDRTYRTRRRGSSDPLYEYAARAARPHVGEAGSVYAWAKAEIASAGHRRAADIDRIEGISKMFRTLSFLAALGTIAAGVLREWYWAVGLLTLALTAFMVFAERRWAATLTVYQTFRSLGEAEPSSTRIIAP